MIMTQFIDSKMKNSGKLEETKPRTDSGRHRYMGRGSTQTGEEPCHPSPLDPEPVPSGVGTQTARGGMFMFMASNTSLGKDLTA